MKDYTSLEELLTLGKFRSMGKKELKEFICTGITAHDYDKLEGKGRREKAKNLMRRWAVESVHEKLENAIRRSFTFPDFTPIPDFTLTPDLCLAGLKSGIRLEYVNPHKYEWMGGEVKARCSDERPEVMVDKKGNIHPMPKIKDPMDEVLPLKKRTLGEIPKLGKPRINVIPKTDIKVDVIFKGWAETLREEANETLEILKSKTPNTMNKEIIKYKLTNENHKEAVNKIVGLLHSGKYWRLESTFPADCIPIEKLKKLGILDLFFTHVYKEEVALEVGKWYKSPKGSLFCYQKGNACYGFHWEDGWNGERWTWKNNKGLIPATNKEVETAFAAEVIKKGYKNGVKFYSASKNSKEAIVFKGDTVKIYVKSNEIFCGSGYGLIFSDGNWATIITQNTLPEINGYQGVDNGGGYIEYGCFCVDKDFIMSMESINITSFNLKVDGEKIKVSKAQTKQLFNYLKK
jgi:hypothetical protein